MRTVVLLYRLIKVKLTTNDAIGKDIIIIIVVMLLLTRIKSYLLTYHLRFTANNNSKSTSQQYV